MVTSGGGHDTLEREVWVVILRHFRVPHVQWLQARLFMQCDRFRGINSRVFGMENENKRREKAKKHKKQDKFLIPGKSCVMDMVIFRTIFFELFSFLHVHAPYPPFRLLTHLGMH